MASPYSKTYLSIGPRRRITSECYDRTVSGDGSSPTRYRSWFEKPLGRRVDLDEKRIVLRLADLKPGERVLDVGCGDGNFTDAAVDATGFAVGLDRCPEMILAAARRLHGIPGAVWVTGDAERLPFPDRAFDAVLVVTVLCFGGAWDTILREALRVLRPGGRIVLGELGRYSWWAVARRLRGILGSRVWHDARFFSRKELRGLLRHAGFVNVATDSAVFYPPLELFARGQFFARSAPEHLARRLCPWSGAFHAVRGIRP